MRIVAIIVFSIFFINGVNKLATNRKSLKTVSALDAIPVGAQKLINSYPLFVTGFANNHIIFKDHSEMIWDDGKKKSAKEILETPDLKDMFSQQYEKDVSSSEPAKNTDPGRIRNEAFFMKLYGSSEKAAENNLTTIDWCPKLVGQKIRVTKVNDVDKKLMEISNELDSHPEWKKYLQNIGGTFVWRNISGTNRHSTHSFGMTIDINIKYSDYWQWACHCTDENAAVKYINRIPQGIVEIFEKNSFIWGGKWYHFDTMHFEYRPELL